MSSKARLRLFTTIRDHLGMHMRSVHARLTRNVFQAGASVRQCDGTCCRQGTVASLDEHTRIMKHANVIAPYLTSRVRHKPDRWFEARVKKDPDYLCGKTLATRVIDGACVFFRSDRLCALQVAGQQELGTAFTLKPAMCLLWPLCVVDGELDVGYASFTRRKECCAPVQNGARTIYDVIGPDDASIRMMARPENSRASRGRRAARSTRRFSALRRE
jgi:hypothetical protein